MMPKAKVMIVEDDSEMIELLCTLVGRDGYEPIPALGGQEALRLLDKTAVDVILLDLMMPDLDGWSVLRAIKENGKTRTAPVIIVTVKSPLEDPAQVQAHTGMFEGYLMKPFAVDDLLIQIEEALA